MIFDSRKKKKKKIRESCRIVALVHFELKKKNDAEPSFLGYHGFPNAICTSVNQVLIHGIPSKYTLKEGDIISVDVGVYKKKYHGDAAFTMGVGRISDRAQKIINASKEALRNAIDIVKPEIKIGDIGYTIENVAKKYGFLVTKDYAGHCVGKKLHENPLIPCYGEKNSGELIEEGMILAIEPMILENTEETSVDALDNWTVRSKTGCLTSHYEHTILVTRNGYEILTKL